MSNSSERTDLEFSAVQNEALGAILLWEFCAAFEENKPSGAAGPTLPVFLPLLPLVFNTHVVAQLYKRRFNGGLFKAISSDRGLILGLQQRTKDMAKQTLECLDVAFASGLLAFDSNSAVITPVMKELPESLDNPETKSMRAAAKRIGTWFAVLPFEQLTYLLGIRF